MQLLLNLRRRAVQGHVDYRKDVNLRAERLDGHGNLFGTLRRLPTEFMGLFCLRFRRWQQLHVLGNGNVNVQRRRR